MKGSKIMFRNNTFLLIRIIDLEEIYNYSFANWVINQAKKYKDELFEWMTRITDNPII